MQFVKPSLNILKHFYSDPGKNLKIILSRELNKVDKLLERKIITRIVYGVVRHHHLLDYIIGKFSQRKLKKIQPDVRLLLKIGAYLLNFSQSFPDYAVVNEIVKLARPKAKGFINGILRNIASNRTELLQEIENLPQPEVVYSISNDLLEHLKKLTPSPESFLDYLRQEPKFHIRVNLNRIAWTEARQLLLDSKITFKYLEKFNSFEIIDSGQVINRLLTGGGFYFQDTGSQLISIIAANYAKKSVLDCCAAPGTKSITLSLLNPNLKIYANDINPKRTVLMKNFLDRCGVTAVEFLVSDIKQTGIENGLDFIIVDAPCTSSGTLRKNPDLKIKINRQLIDRNALNQYEIMKSIITQFSDSTYILYSVCSFIYEESDGVLDKLFHDLHIHRSYRVVELDEILIRYGFSFQKGTYGYYILPNIELQNDLFYISLLRKV